MEGADSEVLTRCQHRDQHMGNLEEDPAIPTDNVIAGALIASLYAPGSGSSFTLFKCSFTQLSLPNGDFGIVEFRRRSCGSIKHVPVETAVLDGLQQVF